MELVVSICIGLDQNQHVIREVRWLSSTFKFELQKL